MRHDMRVGVLGGSFFPPHIGHAAAAAWLRWVDRVDEVWLVPVADHAFGKELAPLEERLRWCEALAREVGPWVRVSAIEGELPTPSYTLRTLEALRERHPEHTFRLVVGTDVLASVDRWYRWDRVVAEFDPIFIGRPGYAAVAGAPEMISVSSTEIRAAMARGEDVSHLVPRRVLELIRGRFQ